MADLTIAQLTQILAAGVDNADLLPLWDDTAQETKKITIAQFKILIGAVSLVNWSEGFSSATQATSQWTPLNAAANVNAAITPKGTGALVAQIPDGTTAGGNARGSYSVDFQMERTNADQVASGGNSGIFSGRYNRVSGDRSYIGGGASNFISSAASVLCGGFQNNLTDVQLSFIGAGDNNTISGLGSNNAIVAGGTNTIGGSGQGAFIGAGSGNTINNLWSFIGAGQSNNISSDYSSIVGGQLNTVSANYSFIGSGFSNLIEGAYSVIGGGFNNLNQSYAGVIGGGDNNTTTYIPYQTIGGGRSNAISGGDSGIFSGSSHTVSSDYAFIGGGRQNTASNTYATVAGGWSNTASGDRSFLGGGETNVVDTNSDYSSIVGGLSNQISGVDYAFIGGGYQGVATLQAQQVYSGGAFSTAGDAQAHELIWRRLVTGSSITELFLDGASVAAILPATNCLWQGTIDIAAICAVQGNGTTPVGNSQGTTYKVTIKRIGTTTTLVGTVQQIGTMNNDPATVGTFTINANDTNESLRIQFTPPATAGSTTVHRVVATFRGLQIQY